MKQKRLFKTFSSVTGIIIISKIFGFLKQMVTASAFGATIETDIISLSQGFIANLEYLLAQTMVTAFIPIYIHAKAESLEKGDRLVSDTAKLFAVIAGALAVIMTVFAYWIAKILAPTYPAELSAQLMRYIRIFSPILVLYILMAVFRALLNANERFIPGELIGINQSVILIFMVLIFGETLGVQTLVLSFFTYNIWNFLFLGGSSRSYWKISVGNPMRNKDIRRMLQMMGPLLFGYSMIYVNQQVDKILVSGLPAGTVTAMNYGAVLSNLVATFIGTFCSILFTYITKNISIGENRAAALLTTRAAAILIALFLPVSIITVLCAEDIVTIVFGRGAFGGNAVTGAALALMGYGFSFVPLVMRELFSRFQYGYQDSKWPTINSTIGIGFNIIFSVILCRRFGVLGVTFASSVSVLICGALNAISAKRHNTFLHFRPILRQIPLWTAGSAVCILICKMGLLRLAEATALLRFLLTACCGGGGYFLVTGYAIYRLFQQRATVNVMDEIK